MKKILFLLLVVSFGVAHAESQPVQEIQSMGLNEYTCAYKVPNAVQGESQTSFSLTIYAADGKTAYAICLTTIGAQIFGEGSDKHLMASHTPVASNKFVPISNIVLARTQ